MASKILIVEDEQALSDAYEMILNKLGYEVETACDGEEALTKAETFDPDLILLDLRMPKLGGIGFLKKFDLEKKHPEVKVIVFSNLDTQSEIDEAYKLGAQRYILKAWASPKELQAVVEDTLSQK